MEVAVPKETTKTREGRIDQFFSGPGARADQWRDLQDMAQAWAAGTVKRSGFEAALADMTATEEYHAYPGAHLMNALRDTAASEDARATAALVTRISNALISRSFRKNGGDWDTRDDDDTAVRDVLPPVLGRGDSHRPYFETLIVTGMPADRWAAAATEWRRLRRPLDGFIYEPVIVGSVEDAFCATMLNGDIAAVIINEGFGFRSRHNAPVLRTLSASMEQQYKVGSDISALQLAQLLKRVRPELDIYIISNRRVEEMAGNPMADVARRIFYSVEDLLELHLAILEGIQDRYETPFFDNLKKYAQRPIGTFHALPIARGKSIFKSDWIRDMGEFYGTNLFLAESSATTGGLDSLLEPTGNIKRAQEKAARAFGADHVFFVTNGTSTSNKMAVQALIGPGDIVIVDRNCHKSHHYGLVLAGAQPYYIDAFPLTQYSMYGSLAIRPIKEALLHLKAEGKLDRAKMIVLTNCTFDGHVANVERTMLECLTIKPDIVFLWDEAWFGFARFSPFLRRRTAMGAAARIRDMLRDPEYRERYNAFRAKVGEIDPKNKALLDTPLLPDPDKVRVRVYESDSVHKSMSSLRQGSVIVVADQDFHRIEPMFKEAFFTHTSTSPNLQIIATLDLARRQMELEGYELVQRAIQIAIELRQAINNHPLISKYFHVATPAEMIPAEYRKSGMTDYGAPGWNVAKTMAALDTDEFFLDPTRITLLCGNAAYDGSQFKALLANDHDIQINKTSRNSVLVQVNINNTRSDVAHLIKALADISRDIEKRLASGGAPEQALFTARVKSLVSDVPDLPNFSRFHDAFRENPKSAA